MSMDIKTCLMDGMACLSACFVHHSPAFASNSLYTWLSLHTNEITKHSLPNESFATPAPVPWSSALFLFFFFFFLFTNLCSSDPETFPYSWELAIVFRITSICCRNFPCSLTRWAFFCKKSFVWYRNRRWFDAARQPPKGSLRDPVRKPLHHCNPLIKEQGGKIPSTETLLHCHQKEHRVRQLRSS